MKKNIIAAALALALCGGVSSAAAAQGYDRHDDRVMHSDWRDRDHDSRYDRRDSMHRNRGWHDNGRWEGNGWYDNGRRHHRHCWVTWRHHHRVRVCR